MLFLRPIILNFLTLQVANLSLQFVYLFLFSTIDLYCKEETKRIQPQEFKSNFSLFRDFFGEEIGEKLYFSCLQSMVLFFKTFWTAVFHEFYEPLERHVQVAHKEARGLFEPACSTSEIGIGTLNIFFK